jgi:hypothetical protein
MKYNCYLRLHYKPKKGVSERIRRIVQKHLDHMYFHKIDHNAIQEAQIEAMVFGESRISVTWDDGTQELKIDHKPHP